MEINYVGKQSLSHLVEKIKERFVSKENGKSLSSNDFTDADKAKLDSIEDGANAYTLPTASLSNLGGVTTTSKVADTKGLTACDMYPLYWTNQ